MAMEDSYVSDFTMLLVFAVTFMLVYLNTRRPAWAPPGPQLLPVIGNLLSLARNPLTALTELRTKYGDVLGLYIGRELTVFVHGYDAIHEILVKRGTVFSWRPDTPFSKLVIRFRSIVFENGKRWKENRQFTQNTFQKLCFSKQSEGIEEKINNELSFFVDKLKRLTAPADIAQDINLSLSNVIFSILHGNRLGYADPKLTWYLDTLNREFKVFRRNQVLLDCFPFMFHLPFGPMAKYNKSWMGNDNTTDAQLRRHFDAYLLENHSSYIEGKETCLVHHLITHFKAEESSTWKEVVASTRDLWVMLHDLMAAGSETTATTIKWILLYIIRNPRIQNKAREEVLQVIGESDTPSTSHRKSMPYLEAVILEGLRIGHVIPLGVPHSAMQDVNFRGYRIPKDTTILLNMASVLRDPVIFPDPDCFKPERFLTDEGDTIIIPEEFIPFSKGPRSCLGETIARIELFLYMATLLQRFEFDRADQDSFPDTDGVIGLTYYPKPYKLKVKKR